MTNKDFKKLKDDLWLAANKLRADSDLKSNDYSSPAGYYLIKIYI